jgi:hypothetical protein
MTIEQSKNQEIDLINMAEFVCAYPIGSIQLDYNIENKSFELLYSKVTVDMLQDTFASFTDSIAHLKKLAKELNYDSILGETGEFNLENSVGRQMKDLEEKVTLFRILLGKIGPFSYKASNYQGIGLDLDKMFQDITTEQSNMIDLIKKLNIDLALTKEEMKKQTDLENTKFDADIIQLQAELNRTRVETAVNQNITKANVEYVLKPVSAAITSSTEAVFETVTTTANQGIIYTSDVLNTTSEKVRKLGKELIVDVALYGGGAISLALLLFLSYKKISFMRAPIATSSSAQQPSSSSSPSSSRKTRKTRFAPEDPAMVAYNKTKEKESEYYRSLNP